VFLKTRDNTYTLKLGGLQLCFFTFAVLDKAYSLFWLVASFTLLSSQPNGLVMSLFGYGYPTDKRPTAGGQQKAAYKLPEAPDTLHLVFHV
jgi:hypothetical protein